MSLLDKQIVFSLNVSKLIAYIYSQGLSITLGEALRTPEQAELYAQQGKGIKDSLHCKKLAIDLNLFNNKKEYLSDSVCYKFAGEYWKNLNSGNRWGGDFTRKDGNHFEMAGGI